VHRCPQARGKSCWRFVLSLGLEDAEAEEWDRLLGFWFLTTLFYRMVSQTSYVGLRILKVVISQTKLGYKASMETQFIGDKSGGGVHCGNYMLL
jgi:hypothetical protein